MNKKNNKNRCAYTDNCSVYKGENQEDANSLIIYRNVFCLRGDRGWQNCKHFADFESETPSSK